MDPSWIEASAGVFEAIGTVGAFITGGVLIRREMQRAHEREEEQQRTQASQVFSVTVCVGERKKKTPDESIGVVWILDEGGVDVYEALYGERPSASSSDAALKVHYTGGYFGLFRTDFYNNSSGPVYDVSIAVGTVSTVDFPLLLPGETVAVGWVEGEIGGERCKLYLGATDILFTDASGMRWHRSNGGNLVRLYGADKPGVFSRRQGPNHLGQPVLSFHVGED